MSVCVPISNSVAIRQTVDEIWRFFTFSKMAVIRHLEFVMCSDHPRRAFGGLYHSAKCGWNRCSCFDNMQVLIFCEFGLKMPIPALKMRVLGDLTP